MKINGWAFWKYKDKNGNLITLAELRKIGLLQDGLIVIHTKVVMI